MKKTITLISAFALGLIVLAAMAPASSAWAGTLKVQPGLWKTKVNVSSNGQPTQPPHDDTHCLTQKEIDEMAEKLAGTTNTPQESCQRTSFKETANSVDFTYQCTGQFAMNGEGHFKFDSPAHYTGAVTTKGNLMGQVVNNLSSMEGTRVSACP